MARTKGYPEALENKLKDRYLYDEDTNPAFTKTVEKISMTIPHMCYQCGHTYSEQSALLVGRSWYA